MEQRIDGLMEEEEDDNSSSVASLPSDHYSERPPPYLEIEEIPSHRWLESHSSFSRSDPDEISTSVASPSYTNERKKNPSFFRWSRLLSPPFQKERTTSLLSFLQQDRDFSGILKGIHRFTFKEIGAATQDFDDGNIIGRGPGKKIVYRGFHPRHHQIAVELFPVDDYRCVEELQNETYVESRTLGYCKHKDKFMLIYEYQQNGSLEHLLCNLVNNSFLSNCKSEGITHHGNSVTGTICCFDPEYLKTGRITEKVHVFCYGVVILEIVSGKRVVDTRREKIGLLRQLHKTLKEQGNLLEFVDPRLCSAYSEEEALTMLKLSALCTKSPSSIRPSISAVVSVLEGKLKVEELIHEQREDDCKYELDYRFPSEKEIDDTETSDDVCTAPGMSEVDIMIPSKENVIQGFIEPMIPSHQTQTCRHEFEFTMTPAQVVENYSHPGMSLMRKVDQHTPPSLTCTTGDTTLESIKNTHEDSSYDDLHRLHVARGDPSYNTDDIDTLFLAIDSTRIPDGTNKLGETTVKVPEAFDELKTLVLSTTLKEALNDETKSKILHLCEVLDDSILSKSQSSLLHHVRYILSFTSELSRVSEIEDTLYVKKCESAELKVEETKEKAKGLRHEATTLRTSIMSTENHINLIKDKITKHEEELARLHHELNALKIQHVDDEKKLEEIRKVVASDAREITQLARWLGEESGKKISTEDRLKHIRECFDQEQEEWKRIQVRFW